MPYDWLATPISALSMAAPCSFDLHPVKPSVEQVYLTRLAVLAQSISSNLGSINDRPAAYRDQLGSPQVVFWYKNATWLSLSLAMSKAGL